MDRFQIYREFITYICLPSSIFINNVNLPRINMAYIDGAHDYITVKKEFKYISEIKKRDDIIIIDDITQTYFPQLVKIIKEIEKTNLYNIEYISIETKGKMGILTKI